MDKLYLVIIGSMVVYFIYDKMFNRKSNIQQKLEGKIKHAQKMINAQKTEIINLKQEAVFTNEKIKKATGGLTIDQFLANGTGARRATR